MDEHQGHPGEPPPGVPPPQSFTQDFRHAPVAARIPEKIGRGVFSTATMILQTGQEFVIDFLATMAQPQQVVARVVLGPATFSQFVAALRINIGKYEQDFGPLAPHPPGPSGMVPGPGGPGGPGSPLVTAVTAGAGGPPASPAPGQPGQQSQPAPPSHPSISDLYEDFKLPDEMLGGVYANAVMIRHTPFEFAFDFIANFFPRSAVTARVYVTAGRILSLIDAMSNAWQKFQQLPRGGPPGAPPA